MPSKLPVIKANTTQENIDKMKVIAQENKRSVAKELEFLIEQRIREYESEHGTIDTEKSKEFQLESIVEQWCEKFYNDILKQAEKNGKTPSEWWKMYLDKISDKKKSKSDFQLLQKYIEERIANNE